MSAAIYIVEDEPALAELMADYVRAAGWVPTVFGDGALALAAIRANPPALIVLDLMLPGLDGLALCRAVREHSDLPIIMVTARVEEIDRLLGLELGADDYLCKPFSPRELVARIKAILRRARTEAQEQILAIDAAGRRALVRGAPLDLTPSEFDLLAALARRPGQVFSRAQLLELAYQDRLDVHDRAVDSHIKNLRRKIEALAPGLDPIVSVYGVGYRFEL
ncbi:response regulator [Massilia haematophila]|uniref:Response regulator n=1 Tax=Massilia haematophila TaxID=457923 RepID=A0ABV7PLV9_9BURK